MLRFSGDLLPPPRAASLTLRYSYSGNWMATCDTPIMVGASPLRHASHTGSGHNPGRHVIAEPPAHIVICCRRMLLTLQMHSIFPSISPQ